MPNQLERIAAARQLEQMGRPLSELLKMGEGTRRLRGPEAHAILRKERTSGYLNRGKGRAIGQRCRRPTCENIIVAGSRLCGYHLDARLDQLRSGDRRFR